MFKSVLTSMLDNFGLTADPETIRLRANERPCPNPFSRLPQPQPYVPVIDSETLADLTLILYQDDHSTELISFIDHICTTTARIDARAFDALLLPYLSSLAINSNAPITEAPLHTLYRTIITNYQTRIIGPQPERTYTTWTRPRVRCTCNDCTPLNTFLSNPHKQTTEIAVGNKRRAHLHQMLGGAGIDCTHETRRGGNPQVLVVTKTERVYERRMDAWEKRMDEFEGWLDELGKVINLEELLGEVYGQFFEVEVDGAMTEPLAEVSGNVQVANGRAGAGVGTKRKADESEVCDLTAPLRNSEDTRDVRRRIEETEALDLTGQ